MIFSELENIELEKRTSHSVGSSDFISLNHLKVDFYFSNVSDVLMRKFNSSISVKPSVKIVIGDCGDIPNLNWLKPLKNLKHFSFWNTKVLDGDISQCKGIDFVSFKNNKNYNHTREEFIKN